MTGRSKPAGKPLRASVPVWSASWPGAFTLLAAATQGQARLLALGWALDAGHGDVRNTVRVRRARESDLARVREWAARGDETAQAILDSIGCRPVPEPDPAPQPAVEDQLALAL